MPPSFSQVWSDGVRSIVTTLHSTQDDRRNDLGSQPVVWGDDNRAESWRLVIEITDAEQRLLKLVVVDPTAQYGLRQTLLVSESGKLFIGFGKTVGVIDITTGQQQLLNSQLPIGIHQFWSWLRTPKAVVLVDELGLVGFALDGTLRWHDGSLEPPHDVTVNGEDVVVEAYSFRGRRGYHGTFSATQGPD